MSNYTQNVFFTPKDSLTSGDPAKKIKGSEMDAEFAEISTAINSKQDASAKDTANGYAGLDSGGLLKVAQWPSSAPLLSASNVWTATQRISNTTPELFFDETDGPADNKKFRWVASGGYLYSQVGNDAENTYTTYMLVTRSGTTVTSIDLTASTSIGLTGPVFVTGTLNVSGASVFAGITATSAIVGGASVLTNNSGLNASNINTGTIGAAYVPSGAVTQYQGSLTISESQITDGSVLARNAGSENINGSWTFSGSSTVSGTFTISGTLTRSGQGRYPYLVGTGNTGGAITLSTSAASGTPANGDIWIQHAA
jgi:hypothetical protein